MTGAVGAGGVAAGGMLGCVMAGAALVGAGGGGAGVLGGGVLGVGAGAGGGGASVSNTASTVFSVRRTTFLAKPELIAHKSKTCNSTTRPTPVRCLRGER